MRQFAALLLAGALSMSAGAQDTLTLNLNQSIDLARSDGSVAEIARLQFEQQDWQYLSFRQLYLPTLSLTGNLPGLERSFQDIVADDGSVVYVERNSTFGRADLTISQTLPLTGGRMSVSSGLGRLNNVLGDADFTQWSSTPLLITLSQPLFQFNDRKWQSRTEPLRYNLAVRQYAEDMEQVALDVTRRFFATYIAEINLQIATTNEAVNDTIFALSQGRFEIGNIAENDLLQSELALLNARSERSSQTIAFRQAVQDLKLAIGLAYDVDLHITPPTDIPIVDVDPADAVAKARRHRPAFANLRLETTRAERDLARARATTGFSALLSASYGLNQRADSFDDVYVDPLNQQRLSLNFSVPIFQWGRGKAEVEAARARLEQVNEDADFSRQELDQEVYFEALRFQQLQEQVLIAAKADTVAARRFDVAKNRYLIGKIDITELFNAQREKDSARRSYVETLQQYWTSYFNLRRMTLFDFRTGRPIAPRL